VGAGGLFLGATGLLATTLTLLRILFLGGLGQTAARSSPDLAITLLVFNVLDLAAYVALLVVSLRLIARRRAVRRFAIVLAGYFVLMGVAQPLVDYRYLLRPEVARLAAQGLDGPGAADLVVRYFGAGLLVLYAVALLAVMSLWAQPRTSGRIAAPVASRRPASVKHADAASSAHSRTAAPCAFTNAPRDWPAATHSWTGNVGLDSFMITGALVAGVTSRGGRVLGLLQHRLYDEGVLTVPALVEVDGRRYGVFVYPRADAEASAHYSAVRALMRAREQAIAVYYADRPIQPTAPSRAFEPLSPEHFSQAPDDRAEAEYALFWPSEDDPRLADSPALGYLDRWFEALDGRCYVLLTLLVQALDIGDGDDEGQPAAYSLSVQPMMVGVSGPGDIELILHASQSQGLWFAFDTRTPAARRNLLLKHLAEAAELLRAATEQKGLPARDDERLVRAGWRQRRNEYLRREAEGTPGLRLGLVAEHGSARLSAAGATSQAERDAVGSEVGEPSEPLLDFARSQLEHALACVQRAASASGDGPNLHPFVATKHGEEQSRTALELANEPEAVAFAPQVLAERREAELAAVVCDGYLRIEGERSDAIVVRAQERGAERSHLLAQRYRVAGRAKVQTLGNWLLTGTEAPFWPGEQPQAEPPSDRLAAFVERRYRDRLDYLTLGGPDAPPLEDDDTLFSPRLEYLKDGETFTIAYMLMGIASALQLAREALAGQPSCDLASLEYDDLTTRNGHPARSIRFWVHERGTARAFLFALPYEPPRAGTAFAASSPPVLLRTADPLFPSGPA
jgi:hypothetical protein